MKKKKRVEVTTTKPFQLSKQANTRLNNYITQIRKGIYSVCEMHTHDSCPSLSKEDFETAYIDKILGQTATAVSASVRAMMSGLQAQKEQELRALMQGEETPAENKVADKTEVKNEKVYQRKT